MHTPLAHGRLTMQSSKHMLIISERGQSDEESEWATSMLMPVPLPLPTGMMTAPTSLSAGIVPCLCLFLFSDAYCYLSFRTDSTPCVLASFYCISFYLSSRRQNMIHFIITSFFIREGDRLVCLLILDSLVVVVLLEKGFFSNLGMLASPRKLQGLIPGFCREKEEINIQFHLNKKQPFAFNLCSSKFSGVANYFASFSSQYIWPRFLCVFVQPGVPAPTHDVEFSLDEVCTRFRNLSRYGTSRIWSWGKTRYIIPYTRNTTPSQYSHDLSSV